MDVVGRTLLLDNHGSDDTDEALNDVASELIRELEFNSVIDKLVERLDGMLLGAIMALDSETLVEIEDVEGLLKPGELVVVTRPEELPAELETAGVVEKLVTVELDTTRVLLLDTMLPYTEGAEDMLIEMLDTTEIAPVGEVGKVFTDV
jgi:hypothetical protein